MIHFFGNLQNTVFAVQSNQALTEETIEKLTWLFGNAPYLNQSEISAAFVGPRATMTSPWSTNAVEITQNMGIEGIIRMEEMHAWHPDFAFDPMLMQKFESLHQAIFDIPITPEPILYIENIAAYNQQEGLALSEQEVTYLNQLSEKLGRKLTDSEVFGFSQVNSEHCRHKIFNGTFVIDGEEQSTSLFQWIKKTSKEHPNEIVSAYKDNVAFVKGPKVTQFAPKSFTSSDIYEKSAFDSVLSLKAETHNFPTTVEPFNGAATGSGGEIRDRLAGGQGSLPLAGTAVYMTSYSRLQENKPWEQKFPERKWLYQTPLDILIKASNGASDFGNKFGQPLISGSLLTFEHNEQEDRLDDMYRYLGFDKVIMLAGGVGYGKLEQAQKQTPKPGDKIVVLGGENYRIGMGGAAVSSADTGAFGSGIELNAIQRSNPEMQKRVANTIRSLVEMEHNPIVSIHDHGAGGHLNCLSELVEHSGGTIDLDKLPVGDPTLSAKEIIGNESQERMGLVIDAKDVPLLTQIAERERAPWYVVGEVTDDHRFTIASSSSQQKPMDFALEDMFGNSPKTILEDKKIAAKYQPLQYQTNLWQDYLLQVLSLEAVACKDWLTNKVDRCVGGKVAKQQTVGALQLPLNNCGVMALDYDSNHGVVTSIGHAPVAAIIQPEAGSRLAIAEALTNLVFSPLEKGLQGVSLSANWMWPCNNPGENARLYQAVQACAEFALGLGINIPTGKDSLSMKQKYTDKEVLSPGTVIISAIAHTHNIRKVVEPVLQSGDGTIVYLPFHQNELALGGSSFAQVLHQLGNQAPDVSDATYFANCFQAVQSQINQNNILAGHDIGSGGWITTLLEMCFAENQLGATIDATAIPAKDWMTLLFHENPGVLLQVTDMQLFAEEFSAKQISFYPLGITNNSGNVQLRFHENQAVLNVATYRDAWFYTSYLLDNHQTKNGLAKVRFDNYKNQGLQLVFPNAFDGEKPEMPSKKPKAAVIREKGSNSERELANALFLAGFEVKDVHMTDLVSGRETLEDVQFIGAVGGFSNSDVLGSAKGWAGAFKYNDKAREALQKFFAREDTLSIGICNGCQLFMELEVIHPELPEHGKMKHNHSGKHECGFTSVTIQPNHSVMLSELAGTTLGVWISHGEGRFHLPLAKENYPIVGTYAYEGYPANPNGSDYNTAMLCDKTGRHLVTMPHLERSIFPWNWANYPKNRSDEVSPWIQAFVNARKWLENK